MDSIADTGGHGTPKADEEASPLGSGRPREWYDDAFCSGGGRFIGQGQKLIACPVCGEMMDVDADGYLFKHRPHIPKSAGGL